MSIIIALAKELKEANVELQQARVDFFGAANKTTYIQYYRSLKKVNDLEERLGCKVEDIHQVVAITNLIDVICQG